VADTTDIGQLAASFSGHKRQRVGVRFEVIGPLFAVIDALTIILAGILGEVVYHFAGDGGPMDIGVASGLGLLASLSYGLVAHRFGLYRLDQLLEGEQDKRRILASWILAILTLVVILFLLKSSANISRGSLVCFFLLGGAGLVLYRHVAMRRLSLALEAGDIRGRRAIVIGTASELDQFTKQDLLTQFGLDEVERFVLSHNVLTGGSQQLLKSQVEMALQRIRHAAVEEIVLTLPWSGLAECELLFRQLRSAPLPVRLLPDRAVSAVLRRQNALPLRLYTVEMQRTPLSRLECVAKRLVDIVVAVTGLILLLPLLAITAIAVRLETKGPVIFRQRRHGFNGVPFIIYKFRTMTAMEDGSAVVQALEQDPRVTRVGRVLRRASIDELPQLWNVLRGEMSIVGPRPHAIIHDHEYGKLIANYAFRHHVKPGITGWAQVKGFRGGTPRLEQMQQRITFDLWYIDNWSLAFDVYIMMRTVFELIQRRNAY
jgi:undecaprenyl-phosphate galactose phosphotransferase/putative colanic acid biosynthesis UDP-glucose lipid carrier transferase